MKFNFTVDINECEYGFDIEEVILDRASSAFIEMLLGDSDYDKNSKSYHLEQMINKKVNEIMTKDFKDEVASSVVERLAGRFERSKQYKELIKGNEIETDHAMKLGLKAMVKELVKAEMKNIFK